MINVGVFVVLSFCFIWFSGYNSNKNIGDTVGCLVVGVFFLLLSFLFGLGWAKDSYVTSYTGNTSWLEGGNLYNILSITPVESGSVVILTTFGDGKSHIRDVMIEGKTDIPSGFCYWDGSNFVKIPSDPKHTKP